MHVFPRALCLSLTATLLAFTLGCATDGGPGSANPAIPTATKTDQLRPGDNLTIALQGVPDPSSNPVQIDDQGFINLPFIGALAAAGTSPAELSTRIRETYVTKKIYTTVDVSVSVTERFVYVGGEVVHPGRIVWAPELTVTKAIQAASGFTLYAKEDKISLVRDEKTYDLNAKLAQKNPGQDPRLMPGDSIQVPRSAF